MMTRFCNLVALFCVYEVLAQQLYLYSQVDIPTFPFLIEKAVDRINERDNFQKKSTVAAVKISKIFVAYFNGTNKKTTI